MGTNLDTNFHELIVPIIVLPTDITLFLVLLVGALHTEAAWRSP
jgi:hypothetical protein